MNPLPLGKVEQKPNFFIFFCNLFGLSVQKSILVSNSNKTYGSQGANVSGSEAKRSLWGIPFTTK